MRTLIMSAILVVLTAIVIDAGDMDAVIAADSNGVYVELREKYGPTITDTCTVVSRVGDCFICTHKDGPIAMYPVCNYSLQAWTVKE
jgi:hypothetical protein